MNRFGVHTRKELLANGVSAAAINGRLRSGRYLRVLPQTYVVGEDTKIARCFAVTRWYDGATISHRTAAWLYGWLGEPEVIEATVPRHARLDTPKWLRLYRRDLDPAVLSESCGVACVTVEQALIDCMGVMKGQEIDRIVDNCLSTTIDAEDLRLLRKRSPGRCGNGKLVAQLRDAATNAASEPERLLARAFSRRNFAMAANTRLGPYIADFMDELARVVVEVDGREYHIDPIVFRKDRRRQNWIVLDKWLILRYAAFDVIADPDDVADEIIRVVRRRRHARR